MRLADPWGDDLDCHPDLHFPALEANVLESIEQRQDLLAAGYLTALALAVLFSESPL
ncbi:MAG: hypothetical protein ACKVQT_23165 [Burkholderiales bacterium]